MSAPTQYDLLGQVAAAEELHDRLRAWRESLRLDCCTGLPCPPGIRPAIRGGQLVTPPAGDPDRYEYPQVRCGRCGDFTFEYGMVINHDRGWVGCPSYRAGEGRRQFADAEEMSAGRHDNLHHPRCARPGCGHAWGIHTSGGWGITLPEEAPCYGHCGCPGYLLPTVTRERFGQLTLFAS